MRHLVKGFDGPFLCNGSRDGVWTYDEKQATCVECLRTALASAEARASAAERERDEALRGRHAAIEAEEKAVEEMQQEIDVRDRDIEAIAYAIGCREEWSNAHDHYDCVRREIDAVVATAKRKRAAESRAADLAAFVGSVAKKPCAYDAPCASDAEGRPHLWCDPCRARALAAAPEAPRPRPETSTSEASATVRAGPDDRAMPAGCDGNRSRDDEVMRVCQRWTAQVSDIMRRLRGAMPDCPDAADLVDEAVRRLRSAPRPGFKMPPRSKEWWLSRAQAEVGTAAAGALSLDPGPFVPPCAAGHETLTAGCEFCAPWLAPAPRPEPRPEGRAVLNVECSECRTVVPLERWPYHAARCAGPAPSPAPSAAPTEPPTTATKETP